MRLSQRPCVGERRHLERTGGAQLAGTCVERRPRRVHVVDEHDTARDGPAHLDAHAPRRETRRPPRLRLARRGSRSSQTCHRRASRTTAHRGASRRHGRTRAPGDGARAWARARARRVREQAGRRVATICAAMRSARASAPRNFSACTTRPRRPLECDWRPRARQRAARHRAARPARRRQRAPRTARAEQPRQGRAARRAERVGRALGRPPAGDARGRRDQRARGGEPVREAGRRHRVDADRSRVPCLRRTATIARNGCGHFVDVRARRAPADRHARLRVRPALAPAARAARPARAPRAPTGRLVPTSAACSPCSSP